MKICFTGDSIMLTPPPKEYWGGGRRPYQGAYEL